MVLFQLFCFLCLHVFHAIALPTTGPLVERDATPTDVGQMSAAVASALATWTPHVPPKVTDPINEWSGIGDSYASGIGSNGLPDATGWGAPCSRYKKSWIMQINSDTRWPGDNTKRKADFGACAGDQMAQVRDRQLMATSYSSDYEAFGKPELAVVSMTGNDVNFADIINACIYLAYSPKVPCEQLLQQTEDKINSLSFQSELVYTLTRIVDAGRNAGGISPPESFSVFIIGYVPFWNAEDKYCDDVSWQWWGKSNLKLTTALRQRMNDMTNKLNTVISDAVTKVETLGVFYVDGFQSKYDGHRFCENAASMSGSSNRPISKDTWFWTDDAYGWIDGSEGTEPHKPSLINITSWEFLAQVLIPDEQERASFQSTPGFPDVTKYPFLASWEALEAAIQSASSKISAQINWPIPETLRRPFHPKGTALYQHADYIMNTVLFRRQQVPTQAAEMKVSCSIAGNGGALYISGKNWPSVQNDQAAGLKAALQDKCKLDKSDGSWSFSGPDNIWDWLFAGPKATGQSTCIQDVLKSQGAPASTQCSDLS